MLEQLETADLATAHHAGKPPRRCKGDIGHQISTLSRSAIVPQETADFLLSNAAKHLRWQKRRVRGVVLRENRLRNTQE
jgi:hypothetical protein